jgi:hypothetical protein
MLTTYFLPSLSIDYTEEIIKSWLPGKGRKNWGEKKRKTPARAREEKHAESRLSFPGAGACINPSLLRIRGINALG